MKSGPYIRDAKVAFWGGLLFYLAGSLLLWDAHEHRGKTRPFTLRFLPGA